MNSFSIEHDLRKLDNELTRIKKKAIDSSVKRGFVRARDKVKKEIINETHSRLNLTKAFIKKGVFDVSKISKETPIGGLYFEVYVPERRVSLETYVTKRQFEKNLQLSKERFSAKNRSKNTKKRSKGVKAKIFRGSSATVYKGTFAAVLKSGLRGVFRRRGEKRVPIDIQTGPGTYSIIKSGSLVRAIKKKAIQEFYKNFRSSYNYLVNKKSK